MIDFDQDTWETCEACEGDGVYFGVSGKNEQPCKCCDGTGKFIFGENDYLANSIP